MIYGLRVEFDVGQNEKTEELLLTINNLIRPKANICKLDCLDRIVKDFKTFENAILTLDSIDQVTHRLIEAIISIRMRYYLYESEIQSINSYEDFINSRCVLLLLVNDVYYYDIYCKDERIMQNISEYIKKELSISFKYIDNYKEISSQM